MSRICISRSGQKETKLFHWLHRAKVALGLDPAELPDARQIIRDW